MKPKSLAKPFANIEALEPRVMLSTWTVMIYMAADNNLGSNGYATVDLLELAALDPLPADVNVSVLVDHYGGDAEQYFIGSAPTALGEVNTGDLLVLKDFVEWSVALEPADNYALVLWDHGAGYEGFCSDWDAGDELTLDELDEALGAIPHIDFIGFDACLMNMVEVAYHIYDQGTYLVASEASEPGTGWNYATWLGALAASPDMTPEELAHMAVVDYGLEYPQPYSEETLSAVDMSNIADLANTLDDFADLMLTTGNDTDWWIAQHAQQLAQSYSTDPDFRDLGEFLLEMIATPGLDYAIRSLAMDAWTYYDACVAYEWHGPEVDATGMSIYLPGPGSTMSTDYDDSLEFVEDTVWEDFLQELIDHGAGGIIPPDRFEDNDTQTDPTYLGFFEGEFTELGLTIDKPGDDDYILFQTIGYGQPEDYVEISFNHSVGDLDLYLYDASWILLDSSAGTGDVETISLEGLPPGIYGIKIAAFGDDICPDYDLTIVAPHMGLGDMLLGVVPTNAGNVYVYDMDGFTNGIPIDGDYLHYDPDDERNDLEIRGQGAKGVEIVARDRILVGGVWQQADFTGLGVAVDGTLYSFKDERSGTGDIAFLAAEQDVLKVTTNSEITGQPKPESILLPAPARWSIPTGVGIYAKNGSIGKVNIQGADPGGSSLLGDVKAPSGFIDSLETAGHVSGEVKACEQIDRLDIGGDFSGTAEAGWYVDRTEVAGNFSGSLSAGWYIDRLDVAGEVTGAGQVMAEWYINRVRVDGSFGGLLQSGWQTNRVEIKGDFTGAIGSDGAMGRVDIGGSMFSTIISGWTLGRLRVEGQINGTISAGWTIDEIRSGGDMTCTVKAGESIKKMSTGGNANGTFTAVNDIGRFSIAGNAEGEVSAGNEINRLGVGGNADLIVNANSINRMEVGQNMPGTASVTANNEMGRLDVGGDMMALINVFGPFDRLTVDGALTSPVGIFVTGQIDKLVAGLGMDTTLQAANVDKLQVEAGDLAGDLWFTNGGGSVRVDNGDFTADLLSGDAGLSKVEVKNGTFKGVIDTSGKIDKFSALATNGGSRAVILADLGIGKLSVKNDMVDTDVGVGVRGVAAGVEVELGKLDVGGAFRSSNVLAGVWNDPDAIEPFSAGCEDGTPYVAPDTLGTVYIGKVSIDGPIGVFGPSTEWAIASKDPMDDFEPEFAGNSQNFGNVNVTKDV